MTNRLVLGQRGAGEYGLFVSKPGVDVLTAADSDLLMGTAIKSIQVLEDGAFTLASLNSTLTVSFTDPGFTPLILFWSARWQITYVFASSTSFTAKAQKDLKSTHSNWSLSTKVFYAVLNIAEPA